jgi:hypothetical protein
MEPKINLNKRVQFGPREVSVIICIVVPERIVHSYKGQHCTEGGERSQSL